jgi:hypothetical protein
VLGGGWLLLGRGADDGKPDSSKRREAPARSASDPGEAGEPGARKEPSLPPSSCDPGLDNCVVAQGRVIYVEALDPDGDGDAHFVTASRQSVTLPGITIFDVRADLRPDPLPEVGDLVGGAGPVYPGHAGQKQIEVTEFHVAR